MKSCSRSFPKDVLIFRSAVASPGCFSREERKKRKSERAEQSELKPAYFSHSLLPSTYAFRVAVVPYSSLTFSFFPRVQRWNKNRVNEGLNGVLAFTVNG